MVSFPLAVVQSSLPLVYFSCLIADVCGPLIASLALDSVSQMFLSAFSLQKREMCVPAVLGDNPEWLTKNTTFLCNFLFQFPTYPYDLRSYHIPTCFNIKMSISPNPQVTLMLWDAVLSRCALQGCVWGTGGTWPSWAAQCLGMGFSMRCIELSMQQGKEQTLTFSCCPKSLATGCPDGFFNLLLHFQMLCPS